MTIEGLCVPGASWSGVLTRNTDHWQIAWVIDRLLTAATEWSRQWLVIDWLRLAELVLQCRGDWRDSVKTLAVRPSLATVASDR